MSAGPNIVSISSRSPRATAAEIDASCRWPAGVLLGFAVAWLIGAGVLGTLAAIKLHAPGFLATSPWLTYGRVQPAAWNALVFGFGLQAGLALAVWLVSRLGGVTFIGGAPLILGSFVWNVGLKIGVVGILAGASTGLEGLELPRFATPILLVGYLAVAGWILVTFAHRVERETYVSQWYLLGALFSFPGIFASGHLLGVCFPLRGVLQAAVQAWFVHALFTYWFGFIALAVLFYVLPRSTGVAVPSRNLAIFGFWSLSFFGGFGGLARLAGGPLPAYMVAGGIVATVLALFPLIAVALNLGPSVRARPLTTAGVAVVGFARISFAALLLVGVLSGLNAFPGVRRFTQFTLFGVGLDQLTLWGVYAAGAFAGVYAMIPALAGREWPIPGLARAHLGLVLAGVALVAIAYPAGGLVQGTALDSPAIPFFQVVKRFIPFASMGTLAQLLFLSGSVLLGANLAGLLLIGCRERCVPAVRSFLAPEARPAEVKA